MKVTKWKLKALIQRLMSSVPFGKSINRLLQKTVTKRLVLNDKRFKIKLTQCAEHIRFSREKTGGPKTPFVALELGTGWHPIVPIGLWLCGASHVYSVDIQPLMSDTQIRETLRFFKKYSEDGRLQQILPFAYDEKIKEMQNIIAGELNGSYSNTLRKFDVSIIVGDARDVPIPSSGIDLFVSNCVLEHIEPQVLKGIFCRFRNIASTHSVMCHLIDLSDHYADFDGSIGVFNFLKFTTKEWAKYNNSFHYHNRLRVSDFRSIYEECGFAVVGEQNRSGKLEELATLPLAEEFQEYAPEDLLVWRSRIVGIVNLSK